MLVAGDIAAIARNNGMTDIATVDYKVGLQAPTSTLKSFQTLTSSDGIYYNKALSILVVTKSGVTLDGYNFSGVSINVQADNVTIKNSYFDASKGSYAINAFAGTSNLTVTNSTFDGLKLDKIGYNDFIASRGYNTAISGNAFLNAPTDAIAIASGSVVGNYIAGGAYATGAHADGIWISKSLGPITISDNVIDWRSSADAPTETNEAIRITGETGDVNDVVITNNILLGGSQTILVSDGATLTHSGSQVGSVTNVNIHENVVDFGKYGSLDLASRPADMVYADNWHASGKPSTAGLEAVGCLPDYATLNKMAAAGSGSAVTGSSKADYILGGDGSNYISAGAGDDVIVGGAGRDYISGGAGANKFVYTSVKNSGIDLISDFKHGQDKLVFSTLDNAPTSLSAWQWLGAETFTGHAWQIRASYASGLTTVQVDANGDLIADFQVQLSGKVNVTTSDFILLDKSKLAPVLSASDAVANVASAAESLAVGAGDGLLSAVSHAASLLSVGGVTVGSVIQGLYGTLKVAADGSYAYTRTASSVPSDAAERFSYTVKDAWGQVASAALVVAVENPNHAPTSSGVAAGAIKEGVSSAVSGALAFSDVDVGDVLSLSVLGQSVLFSDVSGGDRTSLLGVSQVLALKAGFSTATGSLGSTAGSSSWSYGLSNGALDFLGKGETATVVTSVKVEDGRGGSAVKDVVVTATGVNDGPAFTGGATSGAVTETAGRTGSATVLTQTGTIGFSDLDLTDRHAVAVSMGGSGYVGGLTASVVSDAGGQGVIAWTYGAADKALDFLAAGQTLTQSYTLTLTDGNGGLVRQTVVVTLTGTDDLPTIAGATAASWYEGSAASYARSGTLTFADADLTDHVTTSLAGQAVSYVTASGVDLTSSMTAAQTAALKAAFSMPTGDLGSNRGSSAWSYALSDNALDFLGQNDVVKVVTSVKVDDGHGGSAVQDVTVTLKGINDAPVVKAYGAGDAAVSGSVAETAGVSGDASLHVTAGSFGFTDVDLSDAHSVRTTAKGAGYLGTFTSSVSQDTTGGGDGTVGWTFQVADKALDGLAAGQTVTQTYTVQVGDGKSGAATQDVTITLTGASDQFVFQTAATKALATFQPGDTLAVKASAFGGGLTAGALGADWFVDGAAATATGHGQFLNDAAHKQLLWDADGAGGKAALAIATFSAPQTLHHADIVIV